MINHNNIKQTEELNEEIQNVPVNNHSNYAKIIFVFKNRQFFFNLQNMTVENKFTLMYFPGLIDQEKLILKNSIKCVFDQNSNIIYTDIENSNILSKWELILDRQNIFKHKKLTHKTNKLRKIHTHKYFGTYFSIRLKIN